MSLQPNQFNVALTEAVDSFNRDQAAALCEQLIQHLRERDEPYPATHSQTVLKQLRRRRYFDLMQAVADALIQNGQRDAEVRRQYAQSQLDQGNLTAAISTLEELEKDTAPGNDGANAEEYAEARGLLGRAYKDLYMLAGNPGRSRNRRFLEKAIDYYQSIYTDDDSKIWQGINSVALIRRAQADGIELETIAAPEALAVSRASEILAKVTQRYVNQNANMWDYATALEACIGLETKYEEALQWLTRYLRSEWTNAFELGSTYRQLTQVWKLTAAEPPGDRILPVLKGALLQQQGSEIEIGVQEAAGENLGELAADSGYEKVLGTEGFKSFKWFQKCMLRARAVALVEDSVGDAVGTAFVVRGSDLKPEWGDELLLMTNAHVISTDPLVSRALRPEKAVLKFELGHNGNATEYGVEELWSSPPERLDTTLLRPTPQISDVEPMPITPLRPLPGTEQRAYIIGHPRGRKLSFSIHDNYLLDYDDRLLHYRSPTEPGNSGSPVFNDDWDLIGLHHRGMQKMPRLNGKEGTYPANEGIWIQAIIQKLKQDGLT